MKIVIAVGVAIAATLCGACAPRSLILESSAMGPIGTNGELVTADGLTPAYGPHLLPGNVNGGRWSLPNGDYAVPPPIALNDPRLIEFVRQNAHKDDPRETRNLYQTELLRRSDQLCTYYISRIYLVRGGSAAAVQTGVAAIDIVGSLFTSAYALKVFTDVGANLNTTQTFLNNEFLAQELLTKATAQITADRNNLRTMILTNQGKTLAEYPLSRAIYDATEYHNRCNLFQASASLGTGVKPSDARPEAAPQTPAQPASPAAPAANVTPPATTGP